MSKASLLRRSTTVESLRNSVDALGEVAYGLRSAGTLGRLKTVDLSKAELGGIRKALDEMEKQQGEVQAEGLSQLTFFAGIVNVVITTFIFGKYPEHLWVFYGLECALFIPVWWHRMTVDFKGFFFIFDFCWFTSCTFGVYMIASYFNMVPSDWQHTVFLVFYSCGLGPMSWACIILFQGLVFHSLDKTASLFIHYTPTLVTYAILNNPEAVAKSWPGRFPTPAEMDPALFHTYDSFMPEWCFYADKVFLYGWCFYFAWWLCYSTFLLTVGVDLPARGHQTVFANIYERANLGAIMESKLGLRGVRKHALVYLLVHLASSSFAFYWPPMCLRNAGALGGAIAAGSAGAVIGRNAGSAKIGALLGTISGVVVGHYWAPAHLIWIVVVFCSALWMGAGHYDYIFAKKYTWAIAQMLEELES